MFGPLDLSCNEAIVAENFSRCTEVEAAGYDDACIC